MAFPRSFEADGFTSTRTKFKGLLIGTEGGANSGKTEFAASAPGYGLGLGLDRGYQGMLDNPYPPPARNPNILWFPIKVPLNKQIGGADDKEKASKFREYWQAYYKHYIKALDNDDARSVIVDGDSDGYELQTLAEYGKVTQIPPLARTGFNASRRAYIARSFDSGKVVIHTNKLQAKFETERDDQGRVLVDNEGKEIRTWDGKSYERAGDRKNYEYLYAIQLRHLFRPARTIKVLGKPVDKPMEWGVRILMAKANRGVEGMELWGDECNLPTLLQVVYPQFDLSVWGY